MSRGSNHLSWLIHFYGEYMTRNTRLYKFKFKLNGEDTDVIFRDLTALELSFLGNLKDHSMQEEMAGRIAIENINSDNVPWPVRVQIGQKALEYSNEIVSNSKLEEITVKELRQSIEYDYIFYLISIIKRVFPTESIIDLMNLTVKDLIELVVFAEKFIDKKLILETEPLPTQRKKNRKLINPRDLPDQGASLQEAINKLNHTVEY